MSTLIKLSVACSIKADISRCFCILQRALSEVSLFALLLLVCVVGCSAVDEQTVNKNDLVGRWTTLTSKDSEIPNLEIVWDLRPEAKIIVEFWHGNISNSSSGTYALDGNMLELVIERNKTIYRIDKLEKGSEAILQVTEQSSGDVLTFTRESDRADTGA